MSKQFHALAAAAAALMVTAAPASADTLSFNVTADDYLKLYVSADLASPGAVQHDKTSGWSSVSSGSLTLEPGQSVYLLIDADNTHSGPAMFLGDFTLSGGSLLFANGLTTLTTDLVHWRVSETSFAGAAGAPASMGVNAPGLQIWGQRTGIAADATAIWAYPADWSTGHTGHAYFVTQITAVPEPATAWLACGGAALLLGLRRLRRSR
jgi:hypothetical protein